MDREKCLIDLLNPGDLGFCFKSVLHREVPLLTEHHFQKPVLGWTLTRTTKEEQQKMTMCVIVEFLLFLKASSKDIN